MLKETDSFHNMLQTQGSTRNETVKPLEISLYFSKEMKSSYIRCFKLMSIRWFQLTTLNLQREKPD